MRCLEVSVRCPEAAVSHDTDGMNVAPHAKRLFCVYLRHLICFKTRSDLVHERELREEGER